MSNEQAAKFVDAQRYISLNKKEDITFETVLSSKYKLDILKIAKEQGYFIKRIFVLTSNPLINIARVEARVISGGHSVDHNKIIERYHKSLNNIKISIGLYDILHVYDNTEKSVRIIRKHKEDISIFPNRLWSEYRILNLIG